MNASLSSHRLSSIDMARGIIMIIMALDHVREYLHADAFLFSPVDLTKTTTALFFTRWITHYCMPTFVFLAGTAIYLSAQRKSKSELAKYLLWRGLMLIVIEFTIMRFIFYFNFYYDLTILSVFWLFGWCMILMAGLLYLSEAALLSIGLAILLLHDLSALVPVDTTSVWFAPWTILFRAGFLPATPTVAFVSSYPIIPWLGVMLLGYSLGRWYRPSVAPENRKRWLIQAGVISILLFVVLRWINVYGDPAPWSTQPTSWYTVLSFLNATKYPVSLLFILMTVGPLLLLLAYLENIQSSALTAIQTIGRVPFFYFVMHFLLIHVAAVVINMINTGKSLSEIDFHASASLGGATAEGGISLAGVYFAWVILLIVMYPLCRWYNRVRSSGKYAWITSL